MIDPADVYLIKAVASLAGAESEFANGRYDNCANRCYYAFFQASIAALVHAGLAAERGGRIWDHRFVQAEFFGRLINRQRVYPARLRQTLSQNRELRDRADYTTQLVSEVQARRAVQRSRDFVAAVREEVTTDEN
jgi:uncharacterized protein (UPF0332 family)